MTARKSASALLVPTTPTDPNHAASKSYVDSSISSATSGVNVAMDHVTGLVAALGGKMDKSVIDAKGEIVAGTAANTPGIVTAPSSDGQFLKSAAAQATGMLWATLAASDVGLGNVNNTSDSVKSVASAATLTTPRNINGVPFDGSAAITVNAVDSTAREPAIAAGSTAQYWRGDKSWQALTQDAVPDGTTNKAYSATDKTRLANTSGTNTGDQTTITGNAGTATKLATARAINGVNFDGSAAITINAVDSTAREPSIAAGTTAQYWRGDKSWQAISSLAAGTAATLATPRAINGVNFDGSAPITINAVDATAREPSIAAGTAAQYWRGDKSWQTLNSAAVGLGNVDNTSDVTKNAAAVTLTNKTLDGTNSLSGPKLAAAGLIDANGKNLLLPSAIASAVNYAQLANAATGAGPALAAAGTDTNVDLNLNSKGSGLVKANGVQVVDLSSAQSLTNKNLAGAGNTFPTLNQSTTGNAATATALATPRAINGVNFDGSAAITVADATKLPLAGGTLTGLLTLSGAPTSALHAATKTYVDTLERTWGPEAIICQGTLVVGYNDLPGGFAVEPGPNAGGVILDAVWMRMGTIGASVTAQCVLDVYVGTATTQGSLAISITLAAAATNQIATLGTPLSMAANAVVRVYCSTAGTVTGPLHCQLRGRYHA